MKNTRNQKFTKSALAIAAIALLGCGSLYAEDSPELATALVTKQDTTDGTQYTIDSSLIHHFSGVYKYTQVIANDMNQILALLFETPPAIGDDIHNYQVLNTLQVQSADTAKQSTDDLSSAYQKYMTDSDAADADIIGAGYNIDATDHNGYSSLSAYSLLGPSTFTDNNVTASSATYNDDQQAAAANYIQFLSGNALVLSPPPAATSDSSFDNHSAINTNRTLAAVQSLGAYNLSTIYADRKASNDSSSALGVTEAAPNNNGKISEQQLQHYIQGQKVTDPDWYKQMQSASPFTVAREMLYMMAGSYSLMYKMEQTQEQLLATQTATNTLLTATIKSMNDMMNKAKSSASMATSSGASFTPTDSGS